MIRNSNAMSINISLIAVRKNSEGSIRIEYNLTDGKSEPVRLWYVIPRSYEEFLTVDVADSVVVGILIYAMRKRTAIVSDIPISSNLYFGLTKYLMPFLTKINHELSIIDISMPLSDKVYNGKHVGTGISCGVDSLSSIIYHGEEEDIPGFKIDTLTLLNTGYYGAQENNTEHYKRYLSQSRTFCQEHDYRFFTLDSNISNITHYDFLTAHTYLTCSVILLLQNYFNRYYYSSGYPVMNFKATFADPAYYDIFLLGCISPQSLKFVSSCSTMSRVEKTALVLRHPNIEKSLYVCLGGNPPVNCCKCEKCVRTMLAIESLGKLGEITFKYNKEAFEKNHIRYVSYMLRHRKSNVFYQEIYESFKKNNVSIPWLGRFCFIPPTFEIMKFVGKFRNTRLGEWTVQKVKSYIKR